MLQAWNLSEIYNGRAIYSDRIILRCGCMRPCYTDQVIDSAFPLEQPASIRQRKMRLTLFRCSEALQSSDPPSDSAYSGDSLQGRVDEDAEPPSILL